MVGLYFIFSIVCPAFSYSQEIPFLARENAILMVFNQLRERENAIIRESMQEAQMKLLRSALEAKGKEKSGEKKSHFSLKKIPSQIHMYLSESVSYNDNVDSQDDIKKSTIVNTFVPGFKMNIQDKQKNIALDSHIDNVFYNNRRRSNAQSLRTDLLANFNIKRYVFSVSNNYYTNYFASEKFGVDDDENQNYWTDSVNLILARNFNRIGFDLKYGRTYSFYESLYKTSDSINESVTFNQYLRLATKTRLLFGYTYGRTTHPHTFNPDNSSGNGMTVTLTGILSPKVTALGEIGYSLTDSKTGSDSRNTSFAGQLSHRISKRSNLSLNLSRYIHEESTKSNYYIRNGLQLSGNHRLAFNPKFNLSFNSGATYTYYPKKSDYEQIDESYALGLGLSYAFRDWLDFSISWSHAKSESNANIDYIVNTLTFSTQARF